MSLGNRKHQRGLAGLRDCRINRRASIQQGLHDAGIPCARR